MDADAIAAARREGGASKASAARGRVCRVTGDKTDIGEARAKANTEVVCGAEDGGIGGCIAASAFAGDGGLDTSAIDTGEGVLAEGTGRKVTGLIEADLTGADLDHGVILIAGKVNAGCPSVGILLADDTSAGAILKATGVGGLGCSDIDAKLAVVAICGGLAGLVETCARAAFIDATVAIVVDAIAANFGLGSDIACTSSPLAVSAVFYAVAASANASCTRCACVARSGLSCGTNATAFVDLSIAVVIDVIAADLLWLGFGFARASAPLAALAGADA